MRIKSYFVKSVEEAMAQARAELGEDALLLNTRRASLPEGSAAGYEVVFGCLEASAEGSDAALETARPAVAPPPAAPIPIAAARPARKAEPAAAGLDQLRAQMDEIHGLLLSAGRTRSMERGLPWLDKIFARLTKGGFSAALAGAIVDGVAAALPDGGPAGQDQVIELLRNEISARIKTDSGLGVASSGCAVIALVGPGGAGKTATLTKIATFQAGPQRPVRLLALPGPGIGSRMELQFFARKTGIAFTAVETVELLPALIEEARQKEIVLLDTPGNQTAAERQRLGAALAGTPGVDVHLVLPAYMSAGACREAIRKYSVFWPSKLVMTKLDETPAFGTVVSEAVRAGLSLSLVTDGVAIPDSLHAASADDLVDIALGSDALAAAACA